VAHVSVGVSGSTPIAGKKLGIYVLSGLNPFAADHDYDREVSLKLWRCP
jgi:hypothetical protein